MKHLFLTSSIGTPGVGESIRRQLGHNKPLKTAFITTPVEPPEEQNDLSWYEQDRDALRKSGFDFFDYTITNKNSEEIEQNIGDVKCIYVSGGNTPYLLDQSQKSGFTKFIRKFVNSGKLYIGTSAGSMIAGPQLPLYLREVDGDNSNLSDYTGYALVEFTIVPHWGSKDFHDLYLGERINKMYTTDYKMILLNNYEYIEVLGDKYRIIDVRSEK
jgi:dipeptidase E